MLAASAQPHVGPSRTNINCCSRLLFWHAASLVRTYAASLDATERFTYDKNHAKLWQLDPANRTETAFARFEPVWNKELHTNPTKPNLFRTLFRTFVMDWLWFMFLLLVYAALGFVMPILLPYLMAYLRGVGTTVPIWHGFVYLAGIFVAAIIGTLTHYHGQLCSYEFGLRIRSCLVVLVYQRVLSMRVPHAPTVVPSAVGGGAGPPTGRPGARPAAAALVPSPVPSSKTGTEPTPSAPTGRGPVSPASQATILISVDAQVILDTMGIFSIATIAPLQIVGALILIALQLGWVAAIPAGLLVLSIPINRYLVAKTKENRTQQQRLTDTRVKFIREFIGMIRVVKYHVWEKPFVRQIDSARQHELTRGILTALWLRVWMLIVMVNIPTLAVGITFLTYAYVATLDISTVFSAIALFNQLRAPFVLFPLMLTFGTQYQVMVERIRNFVSPPPTSSPSSSSATTTTTMTPSSSASIVGLIEKKRNSGVSPAKFPIKLDKVVLFGGNGGTGRPTSVEDILEKSSSACSFRVRRGQCVMVVGKVGHGKSTLLKALLQEHVPTQGSIHVKGAVAYVPQEPWMFATTIRENITFGATYHEKRMRRVLEMCSLTTDMSAMTLGDLTEVGERGVNLSGGQRQRISLARALYANHDIYLLDNTLNACDPVVANRIYEKVFCGWFKKHGKTVVCVVNDMHFIQPNIVDHVLSMNTIPGHITLESSVSDFVRRSGASSALPSSSVDGVALVSRNTRPAIQRPTVQSSSKNANESAGGIMSSLEKNSRTGAPPTSVSNEEEDRQGNLPPSLYGRYISYGGTPLFLWLLFTFALRIVARAYTSVWLSAWADDAALASPTYSTTVWVGIYIGNILGDICSVVCMYLLSLRWNTRAARKTHERALHRVSTATVEWFDANPSGRLLTRFTKDTQVVDLQIPQTTEQTFNFAANLLSLIVQLVIGNPMIVIVVVVVFVGDAFFLGWYRKSSVILQRMEAKSRAPILSHLSQTFDGAATIRSFGLQKEFMQVFMHKVDHNSIDFMGSRYCQAWFSVLLNGTSTIIVIATYLIIMLTRIYGSPTFDMAAAALAMSAISAITTLISTLSFNLVELERKMNSFERLVEYESLPCEEEGAEQDILPPSDNETTEITRKRGHILISHLSVELGGQRILSDINVGIKPRTKVGIVGRTGAGKSTFVAALFRIIPLADHSIIKIDGQDILSKNLSLSQHRARLAMIPQVPTLFQGTLRFNLDPHGKYTDDVLHSALRLVDIDGTISQLMQKVTMPTLPSTTATVAAVACSPLGDNSIAPTGTILDLTIIEGGRNISLGQKQLIVLARTWLQRKEFDILVLDEATSAVDIALDEGMQAMIRKEFAKKTVLIITHQMKTVMDQCDKVMVLDKGELVEHDSPSGLLKQKHSTFAQFVHATTTTTSLTKQQSLPIPK